MRLAATHCGEACLAGPFFNNPRGYASRYLGGIASLGFIASDGEASLAAVHCGKPLFRTTTQIGAGIAFFKICVICG